MAFKHCRPVISVDGTFLTGQFKGTLLVAIAHDANDRLLPLAFALVTADNNDNWASKLTMDNVPWHADVKEFSEVLAAKSFSIFTA